MRSSNAYCIIRTAVAVMTNSHLACVPYIMCYVCVCVKGCCTPAIFQKSGRVLVHSKKHKRKLLK